MSEIKDFQDFTKGNILNKMIKFMMPILLSLILQSLYGAVDLWIVGHYGTEAGISGVGIGSNVMNFFTMLINGITIGVTVLVGQYIGAKKYENVNTLIGNAVAFFSVFSVVLSILIIVLAKPIAVVIMHTPEEAIKNTVEYIQICGAGFIFICFYNFISAILRGVGDSKNPLIFVAIACAVNIIGDLFFVAVFKMNVIGAAIATVLAQAVSVILSLIIIKKKNLPFRFHRKEFFFGPEVPKFVKLGLPITVQTSLTNLSFLLLYSFINKLGLDASSGYGIAQKIQMFILLIPSALGQTVAPFVSQNVGAKDEKRARKGLLCGQGIGVAIGTVIMIITFFYGNIFARFFTENENYITRAFEFLRGFSLEAVVTCILFCYIGYFNGHGKSLFVMIQGLIQSFLIRLPVSYIMSIQPNASLTWIGFAAPCATVFGIVLCLIYYKKMGKYLDRK